jgi:hypothetical protein
MTPNLDRRSAQRFMWRAAVTPAVFFLSIPLAFWQPVLAQMSWGLIRVGIYILSRRG